LILGSATEHSEDSLEAVRGLEPTLLMTKKGRKKKSIAKERKKETEREREIMKNRGVKLE